MAVTISTAIHKNSFLSLFVTRFVGPCRPNDRMHFCLALCISFILDIEKLCPSFKLCNSLWVKCDATKCCSSYLSGRNQQERIWLACFEMCWQKSCLTTSLAFPPLRKHFLGACYPIDMWDKHEMCLLGVNPQLCKHVLSGWLLNVQQVELAVSQFKMTRFQIPDSHWESLTKTSIWSSHWNFKFLDDDNIGSELDSTVTKHKNSVEIQKSGGLWLASEAIISSEKACSAVRLGFVTAGSRGSLHRHCVLFWASSLISHTC